jgi:hypothetical protein
MLKLDMGKSALKKPKNLSLLLLILACSILAFLGVSFFGLRQRQPEKVADLGCACSDFSGTIDLSAKLAVFEGKTVNIPELAYAEEPRKVLSVAHEERWIEVDLSDQKLRAWEGDRLFLETPVSTGLPWWPTPQGEFRIWVKLRATRMEGGEGRYYYNLPNVPYVMYIENSDVPGWRGYGLHGTYWHNDFGTPRSHGCVNLPTEIAKELYYWTEPELPNGKSSVFASEQNPGTRVVIHE